MACKVSAWAVYARGLDLVIVVAAVFFFVPAVSGFCCGEFSGAN